MKNVVYSIPVAKGESSSDAAYVNGARSEAETILVLLVSSFGSSVASFVLFDTFPAFGGKSFSLILIAQTP